MNQQPIDRLQLKQLEAVMDVVISRFAVECGLLKPYLTITQAYKRYGRGTVDRWAAEGLIEVIKDGTRNSKCRIKRSQIELVAATQNRASWFDNHE